MHPAFSDTPDRTQSEPTMSEPSSTTTHPGCRHKPPCPAYNTPGHATAEVLATHPEQGWSLLCNGVVLLEDTGEILPNGDVIQPHLPAAPRATVTA
jgi:hypothetical protein